MDRVLDDLFHKRGSTREAALSVIIDDFNVKYRSQFAGKNFATLLYRCLNSFKKGSSKEIVLAARAIGLLAITIGCGDNANEIYKESLPLISQALKSGTQSLSLSMIDCLAMITFVGGKDFVETEASMQIIWDFIHERPSENDVLKEKTDSVLAAAVSAWSLLLTTIDGWNIHHNHWQGAISFFVDLLEADDQSVHMAAVEALALICEIGCLEKFGNNNADSSFSSIDKGKNVSNHHLSMQELTQIISDHAQRVMRSSTVDSKATKALKTDFSWNILKVLEGGHFHETSLKIGKHSLQLRTLSQLLQVKFIKHYLGEGFVQHMMENVFLSDVFNFTRRKHSLGIELYTSEREEVTINLFVPEHRRNDDEEDSRKAQRSSNSAVRKAKTRLLNKQRMLKGEELSPFHD